MKIHLVPSLTFRQLRKNFEARKESMIGVLLTLAVTGGVDTLLVGDINWMGGTCDHCHMYDVKVLSWKRVWDGRGEEKT